MPTAPPSSPDLIQQKSLAISFIHPQQGKNLLIADEYVFNYIKQQPSNIESVHVINIQQEVRPKKAKAIPIQRHSHNLDERYYDSIINA
ncbi:unnamed protein product [Rotaria sp. Silwood2]|nr:unnamed protein product [Rotaria sp. Silwood2]CAF4084544.1 unnamed protein product [Rotaria sp. Silwood2]